MKPLSDEMMKGRGYMAANRCVEGDPIAHCTLTGIMQFQNNRNTDMSTKQAYSNVESRQASCNCSIAVLGTEFVDEFHVVNVAKKE